MGTYLFGALSKHVAYTYMEQQAQLKKGLRTKKQPQPDFQQKHFCVF